MGVVCSRMAGLDVGLPTTTGWEVGLRMVGLGVGVDLLATGDAGRRAAARGALQQVLCQDAGQLSRGCPALWHEIKG